tara:strand:- start:174 stop:662 length:489 start_codon:yes stop_codon:yes gene_type:complete
MDSNIREIKNFLEEDTYNNIKKAIRSNAFPWFYYNEQSFEDKYYFQHTFFDWHEKTSPLFDEIFPVLEKLKPNMITEVKAVLFMKEAVIYHQTPLMRDRSFDCKTAVLFLDSNNGKLIIENGIDIVKIKPEDNKMVLFENSKYATAVQQNYVRGIKLIINYT